MIPVTTHTLLVTLHLFGMALGLGGAAIADALVLGRMLFRPIHPTDVALVRVLSRAVAVGLVVLCVTGTALVVETAILDRAVLANEKLQAKLVIVLVLAVNVPAIHGLVLPHLSRQVGRRLFEGVPTSTLAALTLAGAVSSASWLSPALLGVARELNGRPVLSGTLTAWACAVAVAWTLGTALGVASRGYPPLLWRWRCPTVPGG